MNSVLEYAGRTTDRPTKIDVYENTLLWNLEFSDSKRGKQNYLEIPVCKCQKYLYLGTWYCDIWHACRVFWQMSGPSSSTQIATTFFAKFRNRFRVYFILPPPSSSSAWTKIKTPLRSTPQSAFVSFRRNTILLPIFNSTPILSIFMLLSIKKVKREQNRFLQQPPETFPLDLVTIKPLYYLWISKSIERPFGW